MHFKPDPNEEAFRAKVRQQIRDNLPADLAARGKRHYTPTRDEMLRWQGILHQQGLSAPHWETADGGLGWNGRQRMIFDQELAAAHAPVVNVQGLTLFAPVLNAFGTPEQKARFREPMLSGKVVWCQGFSEPGAGSDLAGLRTRAIKNPDGGWTVNGHKIWTSQANLADWVFLLARTSDAAKKQQGISFFVIDMKTPGISVKPIVSIDAQHHLNETFYDNVHVPAQNLIGEEGKGWDIAKFLLTNERLFGSADMPALYHSLARVKEIAAAETRNGAPLIEDGNFAQRLARLEIQVAALEMKLMGTVSRRDLSERDLSIIGSAIKVRATEVYMALTELAVEALGDWGVVALPDPDRSNVATPAPEHALGSAVAYFYSRAASIYGGTNEIQRNIIAKAKYGL